MISMRELVTAMEKSHGMLRHVRSEINEDFHSFVDNMGKDESSSPIDKKLMKVKEVLNTTTEVILKLSYLLEPVLSTDESDVEDLSRTREVTQSTIEDKLDDIFDQGNLNLVNLRRLIERIRV